MSMIRGTEGIEGRRWQMWLDVAAAVAMLVAAGTVAVVLLRGYFSANQLSQAAMRAAAGGGGGPKVPKDPIALDGAVTRGSTAAKVVLLEFLDYQCPFCGRFERDTMPAIEKTYVDTGRVELAVRNYPLTKIHPFAVGAATAALCAGQQGRYWDMHDALFSDQAHLDADALGARARKLGLDLQRFDACRTGNDVVAKTISSAGDQARALGITGTPTLMVGVRGADGRVKVIRALAGAQPEKNIAAAVDAGLAAASASGQE